VNKVGQIKNKNILFLQGPMGTFFKELDLHFRKYGANTFKITLNTADWFFSNRDNTYPFKGQQGEWESFIEDFLKKKEIDKIFLFGDCRFYQRNAIQIATKLKIDVFVFEEGYIRPDFITMERYGVNNFSKISRDANFYSNLDEKYLKSIDTLLAYPKYSKMGFSSTIYYLLTYFTKNKYPHYVHHREIDIKKEFLYLCKNAFRKMKYKFTEQDLIQKITTELSKKYYFVPLQTYNDFQLIEHSRFKSVEEFIEKVLISFANNAPKEKFLIIKHHPVDRGRKNYEAFIYELSSKLNIENRVITVHDLHLPTCLKNAIGTITINSTVGISSLFHQIPTLTLGDAIYDIEGLTSRNITLDDFWNKYQKPNDILFKKFRNYLIETTQLNGSFYGRFPIEFSKSEMYS